MAWQGHSITLTLTAVTNPRGTGWKSGNTNKVESCLKQGKTSKLVDHMFALIPHLWNYGFSINSIIPEWRQNWF